jgi:hypothetical protein
MNKMIFQIILILIVVSLLGCVQTNDAVKITIPNERLPSNVKETAEVTVTNISSVANEREIESEVEACEHCSYSLGLCTYDSDCLYVLANDIDDCSEIYSLVGASSKKFDSFEDRCVAQLAIRQNSLDTCLKAKTKIGDCAPKVVSTINDFKFCDTIDALRLNNYSTKQCYLDIAKKDTAFDVKICDKVFGLDYDDCYVVVAATQNNLSLCKELSSESKKETCQEQYVVMNRKNNLLLCNQSSNSGACAKEVLVELGNIVTKAQCVQLQTQIVGVGHDTYSKCFNLVALRDLDLDSCNRISSNNPENDLLKQECINKVNHLLGVAE